MSNSYLVQNAAVKQTKAGKDYLQLTINDKFVSFFEEKDVRYHVEAGDTITCRIVQKGTFLNGYDIKKGEDPNAPVSKELSFEVIKNENEVVAGNRVYYMDVKVAKNGTKYLLLSQNFKNEKQTIMVFADHIKEFAELFNKKVKDF